MKGRMWYLPSVLEAATLLGRFEVSIKGRPNNLRKALESSVVFVRRRAWQVRLFLPSGPAGLASIATGLLLV